MTLNKFLRGLKNQMKDSTSLHAEKEIGTVAFLIRYEIAWVTGMIISSGCALVGLDSDQ